MDLSGGGASKKSIDKTLSSRAKGGSQGTKELDNVGRYVANVILYTFSV